MSNEAAWLAARNLLCIRLDSLGDVLMTSPALRALKEAQPHRRISLLTSRAGAQVAPLLEEIDQTIVYEAPWMKATPAPAGRDAQLRMLENLRRVGFDAAVIFTSFSQSPLPAAWMAFLADIPLRLAYCRENPYQLLSDWLPELEQAGQANIRHEVRRQLDLVAHTGARPANEAISIRVPAPSQSKARSLLAGLGLALNKPWVLVHPGASASSRRYAPEGFAEASDVLAAQHGIQVVFSGSAGEADLVEQIRHAMRSPSISLAGRTKTSELAAVISLAPVLISNNSGPVHIAAGVQTPVVDLYALTNPQHTPWMVPHRTLFHDVPCKYCYKSVCPMGHHACLAQVLPQAVVDAALELLGEHWPRPAAKPHAQAEPAR